MSPMSQNEMIQSVADALQHTFYSPRHYIVTEGYRVQPRCAFNAFLGLIGG